MQTNDHLIYVVASRPFAEKAIGRVGSESAFHLVELARRIEAGEKY